jgi:hypothetical protein
MSSDVLDGCKQQPASNSVVDVCPARVLWGTTKEKKLWKEGRENRDKGVKHSRC